MASPLRVQATSAWQATEAVQQPAYRLQNFTQALRDAADLKMAAQAAAQDEAQHARSSAGSASGGHSVTRPPKDYQQIVLPVRVTDMTGVVEVIIQGGNNG